MAIEWKPIEGGFGSVMETALAQSKQLAPQQIDITQGFGGRFVTPEEYYSSKYADTTMNAQQTMWDKYTEIENQRIKDRDAYFNEREAWLNQRQGLLERMNNNPSISSVATNTASSVMPNDSNGYRQAMFDEFRAQGLSENQALGLLLNVEAENNFQSQYLFGTHQDGPRTAYGALSWQGGREKGLLNNLAKAGLYKDGRIVQSADSVKVMASYMVQELKSGTQGNYLNFKGNTPLDYAREANRTFTRSSRKAEVLQGRERQYATALNWYNNRGKK
jgi:hypothetical protein|nr:MAG TPA: Morphogenesis protein 1, infection, phi29, Late protein.8A [Caudoviricetes sp.]